MFKKANRVTRLDKALILGFMAGYRDNPRPNAENVITIKLNESKVSAAGGTSMSQILINHFFSVIRRNKSSSLITQSFRCSSTHLFVSITTTVSGRHSEPSGSSPNSSSKTSRQLNSRKIQ
jgi:hypothetical protein